MIKFPIKFDEYKYYLKFYNLNKFLATKLYMYFDLVADKINSVHRSGGKMIVYCRAGMSRLVSKIFQVFFKRKIFFWE